ncbi:helix-turn-helix transcriptional regulator [Nocardia sp. NPDC005978]|uniref:helix-turn-helix domain-containing protein n=1 Tax=unclassified Nocardia TaxID=2637762 RepID=UPI0033A0A773
MLVLLGIQLRRLRDGCGLTQQQVAAAIHFDASKISRLESGGYRHVPIETVRALLRLYGIPDSAQARYLACGYGDRSDVDHTLRLDLLMDLEPVAKILQYEQALVPVLAQTPRYARAALKSAHPDHARHEIDRMLAQRMRSQLTLGRSNPPHVWMIVENAAFHRPLGGEAVWAEQVEHLLGLAQRPHITLQIIEDHACGPAFVRNPFTCLRFADATVPDLLCQPELADTRFSVVPHETERYRQFHVFLAGQAASSGHTIDLLNELAG